ncbi:MAG TPA: ribonuclease P protein component [Candidatus Binatia bacterium]|nr:ribonuclease P protein component [Candidatus Binatia bacterium]
MAAFPPALRLRRPADFKAALAGGRRLQQPPLTAALVSNALPHARLGLAIAARSVPRAVDRNRIKRQARASFREAVAALPALDIVLLARPGAAAARPAAVNDALRQLWRRATTCARS